MLALQSHPMNLPSCEHRATFPATFASRVGELALEQSSEGVFMYADVAVLGSPVVLGNVFTQHHESPNFKAENPFTGELQSVGPDATPGYVEQVKSCGSMRRRYPRVATVPPFCCFREEAGIGQATETEGSTQPPTPPPTKDSPEGHRLEQSHPTNSPPGEHRAVLPTSSCFMTERLTASEPKQYREDACVEPMGGTTQQKPEPAFPLENPVEGDEQSVGPDADSVQGASPGTWRYPSRGTISAAVYGDLTGTGQVTGPGGTTSGLEARVASGLPEPVPLGSEVPSSQPAKRSARTEMPKKKFFICCSPFLGCNFPHPE
jgi:hypothetical protein